MRRILRRLFMSSATVCDRLGHHYADCPVCIELEDRVPPSLTVCEDCGKRRPLPSPGQGPAR